MATPGPLECLTLGARSLRAHPWLILAAWAEMVLVTALTVIGGALPMAAVGFDRVNAVLFDPGELQRLLLWLAEEARWTDFIPRSPEMIAAWVGLLVAWTLALFAWCWFEAGIYGVLVTAERRDAAGDAGELGWSHLRRAAREAFWRMFGLLHAFVLYLLVVQLLWTWIVWLAVRGWEVWGTGAMLAIGCGGTLPLVLAAVVLGLWFLLARVEVVRAGVTLGQAQRRSWRLLQHRWGAVLVLAILFAVGALIALGLLAPLGLLLEWGLSRGLLWALARLLLEVLQAGLWGLLGVYTGAVWVSLVQTTPNGTEPSPAPAAEGASGGTP